jgi:hypothetical protein
MSLRSLVVGHQPTTLRSKSDLPVMRVCGSQPCLMNRYSWPCPTVKAELQKRRAERYYKIAKTWRYRARASQQDLRTLGQQMIDRAQIRADRWKADP